MLKEKLISGLKDPGVLFCIGWAAVMLALTVSIPPVWDTFMHAWRVDLYAAVFLLFALLYRSFFSKDADRPANLSDSERWLVVLPLCMFIAWSLLSIAWAESGRSAMHHTLVWAEYLIFYLIVRNLLQKPANYSRFTGMLAFTLAFFAVFAIFAYCAYLVFGGVEMLGRVVYPKYGEQINAVFPLLLVGVLRLEGRRFRLGTATLAVLWLLIFCSLGRANILLFIFANASMFAAIFAMKRFHRYRIKMAIVCLALIIAPIPLHISSLFSDAPNVPMVERLNDSSAIGSSNSLRKLMASVAVQMAATHPLAGVGADNFGFRFNDYRGMYADAHPEDANLAEGEMVISERAHNEYLQVLAELGIPGVAIFLWMIASIGVMSIRAMKRMGSVSLFPIAALIGLFTFLASSAVSSYSFRLVQNGFVFFFVLAVASKFLLKDREKSERSGFVIGARLPLNLKLAAGCAACLLMIGYCTIRVASVVYTTKANHTNSLEEAEPNYLEAAALDHENPEPRYFLALRMVDKGRYAEAIPLLKDSIRIGKGSSADFSYLATAQTLQGDMAGAEATFAAAARLYPRSPFVLTRYAVLLKESGKAAESAAQYERAAAIDPRHARSWWVMLTDGPQAAADLAVFNKDYVALMDLRPEPSMYAVRDEREIRHPEEKFKF